MNRLERSSSSKDYGVENSGEKTILTTNNNYEGMTADVQRPRNTIDDLKTFKYIYILGCNRQYSMLQVKPQQH